MSVADVLLTLVVCALVAAAYLAYLRWDRKRP